MSEIIDMEPLEEMARKEVYDFIMNGLRENADASVDEVWKLNYFQDKFLDFDLDVVYKGDFESVVLQIQKLYTTRKNYKGKNIEYDFVRDLVDCLYPHIVCYFIDVCTDEDGILDKNKLYTMKLNIRLVLRGINIMKDFKVSLSNDNNIWSKFWLKKYKVMKA